MNKKGMTLIELMIYIAIAALLLAPVIMLMQNSSVGMARDAVSSDMKMSGRDVLNIMYEDIKNMGFKIQSLNEVEFGVTYLDTAGYGDQLWKMYSSYWTEPVDTSKGCSKPVMAANDMDGSSFMHYYTPDFSDSLVFKKGKLNDSGYDVVKYKVTVTNGKRKLTRAINANSQTIAQDIMALKFYYSPDLTEWWGGTAFPFVSDDDTDKQLIKYVKIIFIQKQSGNNKIAGIDLSKSGIDIGDGDVFDNVEPKIIYERNEIVIPVPNNGLFPVKDECS